MKRLIFFLIVCCHSLCAQQKIVIKDSVLLGILNSFIEELKLEEKQYKLIRVQLISFNKQPKVTSIDTTSVGAIKGLRLETGYDVIYSLALEYEVNSQTINWRPITYYSTYRKIPILISTGFEGFVETSSGNKRELMQVIEKSSNPHVMAPSVIWIVDVHNNEAVITKPSN